jgi:GDP-L-fucose synthase
VWSLESYDGIDPLIISPPTEISIRALANLIAQKMNFDGNIFWDLEKPDGQLRKPSSNAEFIELNPNIYFTPIEEGLERTVRWFTSNFPNIRL